MQWYCVSYEMRMVRRRGCTGDSEYVVQASDITYEIFVRFHLKYDRGVFFFFSNITQTRLRRTILKKKKTIWLNR